MDCAIYTRVSTDNQAEVEFNSCEAQEAKIRSFISSQEGMEVFKVYSDPGYTGANLNRPALQELLDDIKYGKINLVISYKIDRLTRSPRDFYQLIELFDQHGVDFISVTERFDTSTPSGRLLRNIMLIFAQFERELASERTKDKMLQRANKGMWNGGIVPFGYNAVNKKLVVNENDAKAIRITYDDYMEGRSVAEISKDTGLSKSRIASILRNPIYIGTMRYGGKTYQGNHKPIISKDIFELAQEKHKEKKLVLRLYKDYPLAGLLNCKTCNSSMTPCHTNKKKKNRIKRYYYYRCTKTFKKDWDSCDVRQVSAERLEDHIFKNLERISVDKHYIDSLIFKLNNSQAGDRIGLEPTQSCSESLKISAEIFAQTLRLFAKGLSERRGIEKNLWAKKFIKRIEYCKEEILVSLYYKRSFDTELSASPASGRARAAAGRAPHCEVDKKIIPTGTCRDNHETWLPTVDSEHYRGRLSKCKEIHILVKMYRRRSRGTSISLYDPLPTLPQKTKPVYKNIVAMAVKINEYLAQNPQRTYASASNHFGVTRARISQLMTIHEKLPDDFIEKMGECKDQNLIKRFSGKTLLKIAGINTPEQRKSRIDTIIKNL